MSQRLIQPGLSAAGKYHPRTALPVEPIGEINGKLIWPVIGGDENDDPDDPRFQDGGEDEDDDSEDEDDDDSDDDEDEDDKPKKGKGKKKSDDDDDDTDEKPKYTQREYEKLQRRMKAADRRADEATRRAEALEKKTKSKAKPSKSKADDDADDDRDNEETAKERARAEKLEKELRETRLENAFLAVNTINWVDAEDALAAAKRLGLLDDVFDEDGKLDRRELKLALKDLAKRKKYLVKPETDENDEDEKPDRRSGSTMNGKRKGKQGAGPDRKELAKRFPVLNR